MVKVEIIVKPTNCIVALEIFTTKILNQRFENGDGLSVPKSKNGLSIPKSVNVLLGTFRPGTFRPGTFRPGTFRPGKFRPGTFRPGTFRPGDVSSSGSSLQKSWGRAVVGTGFLGDGSSGYRKWYLVMNKFRTYPTMTAIIFAVPCTLLTLFFPTVRGQKSLKTRKNMKISIFYSVIF
jgi:hypothetical protein